MLLVSDPEHPRIRQFRIRSFVILRKRFLSIVQKCGKKPNPSSRSAEPARSIGITVSNRYVFASRFQRPEIQDVQGPMWMLSFDKPDFVGLQDMNLGKK